MVNTLNVTVVVVIVARATVGCAYCSAPIQAPTFAAADPARYCFACLGYDLKAAKHNATSMARQAMEVGAM